MSAGGGGTRRLCILGGSLRDPGGVEVFCERALAAIGAHWHGGEALWIPTNTGYLNPARLGGVIAGLRALRRAHRQPIDIVWLNLSNLPDLAYLLFAKALGIRVIVTLHLGANSRLQRSAILRGICKRLLTRADRIALLFEGQEKEIDLPPSVPRSVIRTFLPRETFVPRPASANGERVLHLIHAGRLTEGKGSLAVVDLCAQLQQAGVAFSARIIGRGDDVTMERLFAKIEGYQLHDKVRLSDWLAEPDLLAALRSADALVHLSRLDSFPLIVLEAMASGTMPVAIEMAGVGVMVAAYDGHLVPPEDAVADGADWLATQSLADLRARGAAMSARVQEDYGWPACVATLIAAAETMLATPPAVAEPVRG